MGPSQGFRLTPSQIAEAQAQAAEGDVCAMRALALHAGMTDRDDASFVYWTARAAYSGDAVSQDVVIDRLLSSGTTGAEGLARYLSEQWSAGSRRRPGCGQTALRYERE